MRLTQVADASQIGHLRARVGNRFDEDHARLRSQRRRDVSRLRGIDKADFDADASKGLEQTGRVAEQEAARNEMITRTQQGKQRRRNGRHATTESDRLQPLLHARDLFLQRRRGRGSLAPIDETGLFTLKHLDEIACIGEAKGSRVVSRFVRRTMLNRLGTVAMQRSGGKSAFIHDVRKIGGG